MKPGEALSYEKEVRELAQAFESMGSGQRAGLPEIRIVEGLAYYTLGLTLDDIVFRKVYFKPLGAKELKLLVRQLSYEILCRARGLSLPYGLLLGIRPVKLLRSLIRETKSDELSAFLMTRLYYVKPAMVSRLLDIYTIQQPYLNLEHRDRRSLYLCIAFCPSRCYYCSFPSNDIQKKAGLLRPYVDALKSEFKLKIEEGLEREPDFLSKIDVVYIGGGTPSALPLELLEELLSFMADYIDLRRLREFCFEAGRVDTLSPELFRLLRKYGVSRLSINPQSMKPDTLRLLGRRHDLEDVKKAFDMARSYGFDNINSDLILGLKNEGMEDMEESLERLIALGPENITLHSLSIKRGSDYALSLSPELGGLAGVEAETLGSGALLGMQERMILRLLKEDYRPYYLYRQKLISGGLDNIGFSKKGSECVYNIRIMEEEHEILGLGAGASSKIKQGDKHLNLRNPKALEAYIMKYCCPS